MRFLMYTDKSVAQSMKAINERLHQAGSKSRPQLDGWVEKNGSFAIAVTTEQRMKMRKKTVLRGKAERDGGVTIVSGTVPGGASKSNQILIFGIFIIIAILTLFNGQALLGITVIIAGALMFFPLSGNYNNSEILLKELQKTLSARFTPPAKKK